MKRILILALMVLSVLSAWAYDFSAVNEDGVEIWYNLLSSSKCEVAQSPSYDYKNDVRIPAAVTYSGKELSVTSIGDYAFYYCSSLTSVEIPNSVTGIREGAFYGCNSLTSVEIPNSVTSIGYSAFSGCSSLTSVEIPNSVTSIGKWAFSGCSSLTSVEIPNSVTSIGHGTFEYCLSLTSVEIPNSVTSIGEAAFYDCTSLTSVEIPNSVTSIGRSAFSWCSSLTSVEIPNSVTSIGEGAFMYCSSLTSVEIGNSVTSIGNWAFEGCSSLTEVKVLAENPPTAGFKAFDYNSSGSLIAKTLYVPTGTKARYEAANVWKDFWEILEFDPQGGELPTQCAAPEVRYADGKLKFTCSTPGAAYRYSLTDTDIKNTKVYSDGDVDLSATYVINVTASADGYTDSDEVTYTLCWYNVEPADDAILTPSLQPAIVTMRGGEVIVEGADGLREVAFFGLDGACLGVVPVVDGRAQIETQRDAVIVRIGDRAVKVVR